MQVKLRTFLKEYFLDSTLGVDYFGTIFKKGANKNLVDALLKAQISSEPGVLQITSYVSSLNGQTRQFTVTWAAKLSNGHQTGTNSVSIGG